MFTVLKDRFCAGVGLVALLLLTLVPQARGADSFLVIGGGNSPSNNQVSLEKNVLFFQHVLNDAIGKSASADVLFSDGWPARAICNLCPMTIRRR